MFDYLEKFERNKKIIIQGFINFYGTMYSDYIREKINKANIVWFDQTAAKESKDIYNCIDTKIPKEQMDYYLSQRKKDIFLQSAYISEFNLLVLPQNYDLNQIIHEINHMLSSHLISTTPYVAISGISYEVEKDGGIMQANKALDEVINELMTYDVLEELSLLDIDINYSESWQEKCFPLVSKFYNDYKESLKKLYMTGDLKEFLSQFDLYSFQEFAQIMFLKLFRIQNKIRNEENVVISDDEIEYVESIIKKMSIREENKKM